MMIETLDADLVASHSAELLRIQHAAYAIEARLIGDDRIPPLREDASALIASGLQWLLMRDDGRIVGALGYRLDEGHLEIDRLVVAPEHHRRGVGRALVHHAQGLATRLTVSTGRDNAPARTLYENLDFIHVRDVEALPGLWISEYHSSRERS